MRAGFIVTGTILLLLAVGGATRGFAKVEQAQNCAMTYGCEIVDPESGERLNMDEYYTQGVILRNGGIALAIISGVLVLVGLVAHPRPEVLPPVVPYHPRPRLPFEPPHVTGFACVHCHGDVDVRDHFCARCGKPLPKPGECPFGCGTKLQGPEVYCPGCGKALVTD